MKSAKRRFWIALLIVTVGCSGQEAAHHAGGNGERFSAAERPHEETDPPVDARDQWILGLSYYMGREVEQDHAKALEWFRLAADQGESTAQMFLGLMHLNGQVVPQSNVKAHMWFSLSAEQEFLAARTRLDRLEAQMTTTEIAEATKLADEWKPAAWTGPRPKK